MAKRIHPKWSAEATALVKAELKRRGVTYGKLVTLLLAIDVVESVPSITNKLSRGGFTFVFYLQCMKALGYSSVTIRLDDLNVGSKPVKS